MQVTQPQAVAKIITRMPIASPSQAASVRRSKAGVESTHQDQPRQAPTPVAHQSIQRISAGQVLMRRVFIQHPSSVGETIRYQLGQFDNEE